VSIPISLVVAVASNGVIGNAGQLPWRISEDLKRFKTLTLGKPIIMGRKTWDSLPRKPLPERTNIVLTHDKNWRAEGAMVAHDFAAAVMLATLEKPGEIMVIGGEAIFAAALGRASRIHLTEVEGDFPGDARMPQFNRDEWRAVAQEGPFSAGSVRYRFLTLERRAVP
jgi:dihydrofolate reductase